MGSVTNKSKSSSQSSNDQPCSYAANEVAIHNFSKFFANNRGPDISIVDVVPSHHLCIASTENRKQLLDLDDTLRTRSARGRGNAQEHTKIKIRKILLRGL